MSLISDAAAFARIAHVGQMRKYSSGVPYITHPFRVAGWVASLVADDNLIAAAYLHDVIEDTTYGEDTIRSVFGGSVAGYVVELTNTTHDKLIPRAERKRLDRERIATISTGAKLVKMVDRWDNLMEMDCQDSEAKRFLRQAYLQESYDLWKVLKQDSNIMLHSGTIMLPTLIELLAVKHKVSLR